MSLHLESPVHELTVTTRRYASSFTLTDVPAGDYTIVIEAGQLAGGSFGLAVSAE
ncbi:MAG TPA: hypothetical protein VER04_04175 [Polyangiaceae bacterium]|nr:hypothetical protein [Polyangiaceae bacterium]